MARYRVPQVEPWFWAAWVIFSLVALAVAVYAFTHDWSGLGLLPLIGGVAGAFNAVRDRRTWKRQLVEREGQPD